MAELHSNYPSNDCRYLAHHGVKGMKWGVRRRERYEAKRKAKYMSKYDITSKQYDSVREKSLKRHAKGTKIRNIARGLKAVDSAMGGYRAGQQIFNASTVYSKANAASTPIETVRGIEAMTIGGTLAGMAISDIRLKSEWAIGRRIVDNIIESSEFERIENKNKNS